MDDLNITTVKERLSHLGISASTPGLSGNDRQKELIRRLNEHNKISQENSSINGTGPIKVPSIADLSMAELKSRLELLNESTSTPSLTGDERKKELMKRLTAAICSDENGTNKTLDQIMDRNSNSTTEIAKVIRSEPPESIASTKENTPKFSLSHSVSKKQELSPPAVISTLSSGLETTTASQISEMKKELVRLQNKRAVVIASRLSGINQDIELKKCESNCIEVETEITSIRQLKNTNISTVSGLLVSSIRVENGKKFPIDQLLLRLEKIKLEWKEQVCIHRQRVRDEENQSLVHGLELEVQLNDKIRTANYSKSKTKRRLDDLRALDAKYGSDMESNPVVAVTDDMSKEIKKKELSIDNIYLTKPNNNNNSPISSSDMITTNKLSLNNMNDNNICYPIKRTVSFGTSEPENIENLQEPIVAIPSLQQSISDKPTSALRGSSGSVKAGRIKMGSISFGPAPPVSPPPAILPTFDNSTCSVDMKNPKSISNNSSTKISESSKSLTTSVTNVTSTATTSTTNVTATSDTTATSTSNVTTFSGDMKGSHSDSDSEDGSGVSDGESETGGTLAPMPVNAMLEEEEDEDEEEKRLHLKALREHVKVLLSIGDMKAAESFLTQALDVDPFDLRTLHSFALFLHQRKGELSRAEAFFRRALQISMPNLLIQMQNKEKLSLTTSTSNEYIIPEAKNESYQSIEKEIFEDVIQLQPGHGTHRLKVKAIVRLLLDYGSFLTRAKGDIEAGLAVLRKAVELAPENSQALSALAKVLAESEYSSSSPVTSTSTGSRRDEIDPTSSHGKSGMKEAEELYGKALRADPNNATILGWYAKLLRKSGRLAQAEVMYKGAVSKSAGTGGKAEALALCNYACFVCKHRKDQARAFVMFQDALVRFPKHKGLIKNFNYLNRHFSIHKTNAVVSFSVTAPLTSSSSSTTGVGQNIPNDVDKIAATPSQQLRQVIEDRDVEQSEINSKQQELTDRIALQALASTQYQNLIETLEAQLQIAIETRELLYTSSRSNQSLHKKYISEIVLKDEEIIILKKQIQESQSAKELLDLDINMKKEYSDR